MFDVKRSQSFRKKNTHYFYQNAIYPLENENESKSSTRIVCFQNTPLSRCNWDQLWYQRGNERFFISINWLVFPYSVNKPLPLFYQFWWCKSKLITNGVVLIVVWSESDFNRLSSDDSAGRSWSQKLNPHNFEGCVWFLCLSRISCYLFV